MYNYIFIEGGVYMLLYKSPYKKILSCTVFKKLLHSSNIIINHKRCTALNRISDRVIIKSNQSNDDVLHK
jgi:hypothetical protein